MEKGKVKYTASELEEFEILLNEKLDAAKTEYKTYVDSLSGKNSEGTASTTGVYHSLENGSETLQKESTNRLAARQAKYIKNLENALIRIKNGTYGICSDSGKLISKERLRAVPHTTQSIDAKRKQNS